MLRRLTFYRDRFIHVLTIIGALASLLGVALPGLASESGIVWWKLGLLIFSLALALVAIWLVVRSGHPTRVFPVGSDADIAKYLYRWINTGGRVLISTRDMSWADTPEMMDLLTLKAGAGELTIVLPEEVERSSALKAEGAAVFTYGHNHDLKAKFTIVNYQKIGSRVAIGWRSRGHHIIQEFSAADEDPTFYLVEDLVRLAQSRGTG